MDVLAVLGIKRTPMQDIAEQIKQQKLATKKAKDEADLAIGKLLIGQINPINNPTLNIPELLSVANSGIQNLYAGAMDIPVLRENLAAERANRQAKNNLDEQVGLSLQQMGINSPQKLKLK